MDKEEKNALIVMMKTPATKHNSLALDII